MIRLLVDLSPCEPALGLALEEALLESARGEGSDSLRIWVNDRAAVIGRSQAARAEVNLDRIGALGIPLLRRLSGGGAVYHYPGNLNVSLFLADARSLGTVEETFRRLGDALARATGGVGGAVIPSGNSLLIGAMKVGGAAQARRGRSLLYHSTLLLRPDAIQMEEILLALQTGYRPSGVPSRPHPTTTLIEAGGGEPDTEPLAASIADAIGAVLRRFVRTAPFTPKETERAAGLAEAKYRSDLWNLSR
jgi:lipoate-protein ligase A